MNVKLLTKHRLEFLSLKGGCIGSSESTLVKMPHFWKSYVTAQLFRSSLLVLFCKPDAGFQQQATFTLQLPPSLYVRVRCIQLRYWTILVHVETFILRYH